MATKTSKPGSPIAWSLAQRPERAAARDTLVVTASFPDGALLALGRGLGGALEAVAGARTVARILRRYARDSLPSLVKRCHRSLLMSPGVVLALAAFHQPTSTLAWLGVGTVRGWIWHAAPAAHPARELLPVVRGVLGYHLPRFPEKRLAFSPGDFLALAIGGLGNKTDPRPERLGDPHAIAEHLLTTASPPLGAVLVARHIPSDHEAHRE